MSSGWMIFCCRGSSAAVFLFFLFTMTITTTSQAFTTTTSILSTQRLLLATTSSSKTQLNFFNFGGGGEKTKEDDGNKDDSTAEENVVVGTAEPEQEQDAVEKIFNFFFGKPEQEPMGLKRFGRERFPEQYPATVNEWADPVAGDDKEMAMYRPLLKNTNLEFRNLKLSYAANRDGWNAAAFHKAVDKKGGGLVVCTTSTGLVCGGYNPKGWVGYGEARGSIAAFLFVQQQKQSGKKGAESSAAGTNDWIKLRKVGGPGLAQMDYPEAGPSFGADSLVIPLDGNNPRRARSKLGSYYERMADGSSSLFGPKDATVRLKDLRVYQGVYEPGEFIPHADAEPFALY